MIKSVILAGVVTLGLSGVALAENGPDNAAPGTVTGSQALPDNGNVPNNRANTDYGTLEPGTADTTHDSQPPTTRGATSSETSAPLIGANSFTQAEATKAIQSQGYTNVSGLAKDNQSVWRGTAVKDGTPVNVALDYRGHVTDTSK